MAGRRYTGNRFASRNPYNSVIDDDTFSVKPFLLFQPNLDAMVKEIRGRNLFFSSDVVGAIKKAHLIFISVNTPTKTYGLGKVSFKLCACMTQHSTTSVFRVVRLI